MKIHRKFDKIVLAWMQGLNFGASVCARIKVMHSQV